MLSEMIQKAENINSGEDGWVSLRGNNNNKSQKAFIVDELTRLIKENQFRLLVSRSKDVIVLLKESWVLTIVKSYNTNSYKYCGIVNTYVLTIFENDREVLSLEDKCDNPIYDSWSPRLPVMDLYDMAVDGEFRRPKTAHMCGLQGFGHSLDDRCPACEEEAKLRHKNS